MVAGLTDGWWEFDGAGDALRLLGNDPDASVFDPASNSNSFTIVGQFSPDAIAVRRRLNPYTQLIVP